MKDVVEEEEEEEKRKKMRLQPVSTASGVGSKGKNEFSFLMGKRESRVEETLAPYRTMEFQLKILPYINRDK